MSAKPAAPEAQTTRAVLMVRPASFGPNLETQATNQFQTLAGIAADTASAASREFDAMVEALDSHGVAVHVAEGSKEEQLPDEVFPNNWFTTHADGTVVLYPLSAVSRRGERRQAIITKLSTEHGYNIGRVLDLSHLESSQQYLEGTGSLVLDRSNRVAYGGLSARTHELALAEFRRALGYELESFSTADAAGRAVYHTNVMMSLGGRFAVVCTDAIQPDPAKRRVLQRLEDGGRGVLEIDLRQLPRFAGNLLELDARNGPLIAASRAGLASLERKQRAQLERFGEILALDVETIERIGGGSVRCMLAEIFLPKGPPQ